MDRHDQKAVLKAFVVDVQSLKASEYGQELVASRMRRFCDVYESRECSGGVANDLGVQGRRLGSSMSYE